MFASGAVLAAIQIPVLWRSSVPEPEPAQPLMVVGAGLGRTGTTSFRSALDRLGFNCYHSRATLQKIHLDAWAEHSRLRLEGKPGVPLKILHMISQQGYNATSGLPPAYLLREMMQNYPSLRVVLNIRGRSDDAAQKWAVSIINAIAPIQSIIKRFPFSWIPQIKKLALIHELYKTEGGHELTKKWIATGTPDFDELTEAYHFWEKLIKDFVPPNQLLVHAPEDGWKPLCDFLSPVDPIIEANCKEILSSAEAYPRVNEAKIFQRVFRGLSLVEYISKFLVVVLLWRLFETIVRKSK